MLPRVTRVTNHSAPKNQLQPPLKTRLRRFLRCHSAAECQWKRGLKTSLCLFFYPNMMQMVWNVHETCWALLAAKIETHWPQNQTLRAFLVLLIFIWTYYLLQGSFIIAIMRINSSKWNTGEPLWAECSTLTQISNKVRCVILKTPGSGCFSLISSSLWACALF